MSSWAEFENTEPVNLEHIISEEITRKLEYVEFKKVIDSFEMIQETEASTTHLDNKEIEQATSVIVVADEDVEKEMDNAQKLETFVNCSYKKVNFRSVGPYDIVLTGKRNTGEKGASNRSKILPTPNKFSQDEFKMDDYTSLLLDKMINNQYISKVNRVIHVGKTTVTLHGYYHSKAKNTPPKECVIKIFKITPPVPEKKAVVQPKYNFFFITYDKKEEQVKEPHFKDKYDEHKTRKSAQSLATREMCSLNKLRLRKAEVLCPEVITINKHILITSFIGKNGESPKKLAHATLKEEDYVTAYKQVVEGMISFYKKANIIHAELSPENILWHENQCYFIDLTQSIESSHPNAKYILMKDCIRITKFFVQNDVPCNARKLFKEITDVDYKDKSSLMELQLEFGVYLGVFDESFWLT